MQRFSRFHPFQGRAPFGRYYRRKTIESCISSFHPFQGRAPFGHEELIASKVTKKTSFHPFQGRAPFGLLKGYFLGVLENMTFPSLSGKSSIRTESFYGFCQDLSRFPSLSGKSSIRTWEQRVPCKGPCNPSFHPFQGRAPFGLHQKAKIARPPAARFPSLSGKSSIRTRRQIVSHTESAESGFHPFQGRPLFGQQDAELLLIIYFIACFHPFQGRPLFGQQLLLARIEVPPDACFHPFQGRPLFGRFETA